MSNVFPKNVIFFPFPEVVGETLGEWTPAEIRLYTELLRRAQKHTATKLHLPDFVIHDCTKLHAETIAIARRKLAKRNLIRCTKGACGVSVYELLNPLTGEALPAPVIGTRKFSGIYIHRSDGRSSRTVRRVSKVVASPPAIAPAWEELGQPRPSQSVSRTEPIREQVTDSLVSGFSEVYESVKVNKLHVASSEIPVSREVLNRGVEGKSSGDAQVKVVKREGVLVEKQNARNDAQQLVENLDSVVLRRARREPVVRRMEELFGARIRTTVDYHKPNLGSGGRDARWGNA
jgi:hypothetical protein